MKKSMISVLFAVLSLLGACAGQQTEKLPQWVMPFVESSHPVRQQDKELSNQDFSFILADHPVDFIGYFGEDYQKMDITFQSVKKVSDTSYLISGFSNVSHHIRPFSGSLHIIDVRELNEYEYGADDFMKGQIHKQGICIARYHLREETEQEDPGVFSGISVFRWYVDKSHDLHYDDTNEDSDNYSNNLFAGVWQSNTGNRTVKCAWGQYRIPDCGDLDIGTAEFAVNPVYAAHGWENTEAEEWYGYYSTEINLPHTGDEPEAGIITYGIYFQPGEYRYYKSQLHANDMYICKVIDVTTDSVTFRAAGQYAPDTNGKPLATLYRKNGKYYLSGPFVLDSEGNADVLIEVGKEGNDETMEEYESLPQQQIDSAYKIISGESGAFHCLIINGKEYRIDEMPDYGEINLNVYANDHSTIILIGLLDTYESLYYVYHFRDGVLMSLGQLSVVQPDDVEINGSKEVSLKVYSENDKIVVESYLDDTYAGKSEFSVQVI